MSFSTLFLILVLKPHTKTHKQKTKIDSKHKQWVNTDIRGQATKLDCYYSDR